ncbi:MAG: 3-methyl-2-oxobutanoate hydroxymethyltransferase [Armatimonadota bacterium]
MGNQLPPRKLIRVPEFIALKGQRPIAMLTAYDFEAARWADEAGVDSILIGDSLGMVVLGHRTTIPVTLEDMVRHGAAVARAKPKALTILDMPFMSYQVSAEQALTNAGLLVQQSGCETVKLEGGVRCAEAIYKITQAGIPVCAHIGMTPQSVNSFGGNRVQGVPDQQAEQLRQDALAVQQAGAFAVVLELIPAALATEITTSLSIPTIGIGAGRGCDGQVQVLHDMLGFGPAKTRKHAKRYIEGRSLMVEAISRYVQEVTSGEFPTEENEF